MRALLLSQDRPQTSSPEQVTTFLGRNNTIGEISDLVAKVRLVTLTGAGGRGKTRLSLKVGSELLSSFTHVVWSVELAPRTKPALVARTVAATFDLNEDLGNSPIEVLQQHLAGKRALLILDNCEHLMAPCRALCQQEPQGDVFAVPTPGHTVGHTWVVVVIDGVHHFLAGDLTYDEDALKSNVIQGPSIAPEAHRQSLRQAREYARANPTVYLPSHDTANAARLYDRLLVVIGD